MIQLRTSRLSLEPFSIEDSLEFAALANDEAVTSVLGLPYPYKLEYAEIWIRQHDELIRSGQEYPFKIIHCDNQSMIGTITLRIDQSNNRGELGYWIGSAYWGEGYATEAIERMIQYGFSELHLHRIWASAIASNLGSIRSLEKNGLLKEGQLRQHKRINNLYEDIVILGIISPQVN